MSNTNLIDVPEALWDKDRLAEYLDLHPVTVLRTAREGRIPCIRIGGLVRFDPTDIREFLKAKPQVQPSAMRRWRCCKIFQEENV
jgi:excisionase family DNA binding protein